MGVIMSVENRIYVKGRPARFVNTDDISGPESLAGANLLEVLLPGIIGLREHYFGQGVRTMSALYTTTDNAQIEALQLWEKYAHNEEVVYRFTASQQDAIKLLTTEVSLGTRKSIYPMSIVVAKLANVVQLSEAHVLNYPNQS